jgi:hypothetical protein
MDYTEYRAALEEMGITMKRAAWLFNGKSGRSGRRWGKQGAPFHVALIISMMQEFNLTPEYIEAMGARWRKKQEGNDAEGEDEEEFEDQEDREG